MFVGGERRRRILPGPCFLKSTAFEMNAVRRFQTFLHDVQEEMKRVSWPTREELMGSALVVFVGVTLLASFIGVWNFVLSRAAQALLR